MLRGQGLRDPAGPSGELLRVAGAALLLRRPAEPSAPRAEQPRGGRCLARSRGAGAGRAGAGGGAHHHGEGHAGGDLAEGVDHQHQHGGVLAAGAARAGVAWTFHRRLLKLC